MATEASQFPGTPVSLGTPNVLISTISVETFTKRFTIVAIYAAIQEGSQRMGRGVSPRIGPYVGSTVMCLNVPKDVSTLACEDCFWDGSKSLKHWIKERSKVSNRTAHFQLRFFLWN